MVERSAVFPTRSLLFVCEDFTHEKQLEVYLRFSNGMGSRGAITIARIDVAPKYQKQGYFTRLLRLLEKLALRYQLAYVRVELVHNEHLEAFLQRDGFTKDRFATVGDFVDSPTWIKRIKGE